MGVAHVEDHTAWLIVFTCVSGNAQMVRRVTQVNSG